MMYLLLCIAFYTVLSDAYRLPNNIKPIRYVLTIAPDLEHELYNGSVLIDLEVAENTETITFHAKNLSIDADNVRIINNETEIKVSKISIDKESETCTVHLDKSLEKGGNYTLAIDKFSGNLRKDRLVGFYAARYKDENGTERRYAVTDFEPADAREAFPCFDEPALKAQFVVNIIRQKQYNSLSNEVLETTIDLGNGQYQDVYKETPKMSTYLLAFVISNFQPTKLMGRFQIYGKPQSITEGKFDLVLDASVEMLKAMEQFTGINYTLTEIKQLALPDSGFATPGMENWGLILYREDDFYWTNVSRLESTQTQFTTISHELSHQWFGNLVTPAWWDYLWLSEGFATYFQFYIPSVIRPSWRVMEQFVVDRMRDSFSATHYGNRPLSYHVENPDDSIAYIIYVKGASIIRMMSHFLTQDLFQKCLGTYLDANKFAAVEPSDLYKALQITIDDADANHLLGNLTIASILQTWTTSTGYPVVNVVRNYETGSIAFGQTRFGGGDHDNGANDTLWHIPVSYAFQSDGKEKLEQTTADLWLSDRSVTINSSGEGWILANIQQTGYYRVNYDLENWNRLIDYLNSDDFETIPALTRAQLIDDAFYLALANQVPFDVLFRLLNYLRRERDYIPIAAFHGIIFPLYSYLKPLHKNPDENFQQFRSMFNYTAPRNLSPKREFILIYRAYLTHILGGAYDYLGIDEKPTDTHMDKLNRAALVGIFKQSHCVKDILAKFEQLKQNSSTYIPPDLQLYIMCAGAKTKGGKQFLEKLLAETTDPIVRKRINNGISCYSNRAKTFKGIVLEFLKPLHSRVKNKKLRHDIPRLNLG